MNIIQNSEVFHCHIDNTTDPNLPVRLSDVPKALLWQPDNKQCKGQGTGQIELPRTKVGRESHPS